MTKRIFILEDHASMRETLAAFVGILPDVECCGAAANAEEALEQIGDARPDLVIVDISLPGMNGLDFIREAKTRWPNLLWVVLTGHNETAYMWRAFSLGAKGYVAKGDADALQTGIQRVLSGQ